MAEAAVAQDSKEKKCAFIEIVLDESLKVEHRSKMGVKFGSIEKGFNRLGKYKIEAISDKKDIIISETSGFVNAVYLAFNHHVPLCFGPDDLWNLIIQGVSIHIEKNAEKLRSKFVDFDGKKVLRIRRDGFIKGSPQNDWAGCFKEWSELITKNIGQKNAKNLVPEFTTTGTLERSMHELALMDCMKSYFEFRATTCCGISKVKLLGTLQDWEMLQKMVSALRQYKLGWWIKHLEPVIDKIVLAYKGEKDKKFWYTIYKQWSTYGSGGTTYVTGWITTFFPYINDQPRQQFANLEELRKEGDTKNPGGRRQKRYSGSIEIYDVPNGVTQTPFIWEYYGKEIPMSIYGGFAGCEFDGDYIRPVLAWAVAKDSASFLKSFIKENGAIETWNGDVVAKWLESSVMKKKVKHFEDFKITGAVLAKGYSELMRKFGYWERGYDRKAGPFSDSDELDDFRSELYDLFKLLRESWEHEN